MTFYWFEAFGVRGSAAAEDSPALAAMADFPPRKNL